MSQGTLEGRAISKTFPGGVTALDGVSFRVPAGRTLALLGPSGCGKSTLLRIIAGLDSADSGSLSHARPPRARVPPGRRAVGFVFQSYALYPHLSVAGNLSLALRARGVAKAEVATRVRETAALLGIDGFLDRRPAELSGGQQQRVALGRALVRRPRLYLLDEPLSNLDAVLRESMRAELKALFRRLDATVLYVTHDQAEAMSLADEVVLLRAGKALQTSPPLDLYARPRHLFVAGFVGSPRMGFWRGRVVDGFLEGRGVRLPVPPGVPPREEVSAGIRPEDVEVSESPFADGGDPGWEAAVEIVEPLGARTLLTCRVGDETIRALAAPREWPARVRVRLPADRIHWFDAKTEERLG